MEKTLEKPPPLKITVSEADSAERTVEPFRIWVAPTLVLQYHRVNILPCWISLEKLRWIREIRGFLED